MQMAELGLDCPLMVVKGDGSLLEADFARTRPVETVLSGPAASQAGVASWQAHQRLSYLILAARQLILPIYVMGRLV